MKPIFSFLWLALVALLLRSTALSSLASRNIILDVLAFATVVWALKYGDDWGATLGFMLGLAADLDAAHWLGRHALGLTLLGYAVGRLSTTLVRESARTQFVMLATATALHQLWSTAFEWSGGLTDLPYLLTRVLVATLVTASVGTLLLMGLRVLSGRPLFGHAQRTSKTYPG